MTTIPRCLCCDQPHTALVWLDGFCVGCVGSVLRELLALADLRPGEVTTIAEILTLAGARTCAAIMTRVPFTPFDGREMRDHE